jgi:hypothetical protein
VEGHAGPQLHRQRLGVGRRRHQRGAWCKR